MKKCEQKTLNVLQFIIPVLKKYKFKWIITGSFACHVYGVPRDITDIDIDIDTSKDSPEFKDFLRELMPQTTQPLEHFVDQNYDNYNFEITINDQIIDICPMREMNIFDKKIGAYINFYKNGFPKPEFVDFQGLKLPLLPKNLIIKNKEMLVQQRDSDLKDIEELKRIL